MEPLSPRSANLPPRTLHTMKRAKAESRPKPLDKGINTDKIDDKWRPSPIVAEPGQDPEIYHTGRKLGKGGFAVCFEGTLKRTGQVFALKVVKSHVEQKKQLDKFRTELQIHAKMQHPNIVEFYRAFAFDQHTYVVLELCSNGSLMEMVKSRSCLSLPEVRRYMIQLCGGVKYMHKRAVIHRDLKMGNLFLDAKMNLKIGDFGLAAIVVSEKERRQTLCGTPNYIAPEILDKRSSGGHDQKVDTWAFGIIFYALLTGGPPFASKTQPEIYAKLKQLEYTWKTDGLNYIPPQAKDLVVACLNLKAEERPEMDDLVDYDFFQMGVIADELSPNCRSTLPNWLENSDPRGDRVTPGYGVKHEAICCACGVGKMSTGKARPAIGINAEASAITEVEIENKQGLAPIVPLPANVIYKQFAAAKEDWTVARKYPVAKVRSRKNPQATGIMNVNDIGKSLPDSIAAQTSAIPTRAPVQSFAAQQRQQAVSSRAVSRVPIPQREQDHQDNNIKDHIPTLKSSREFLRERPLRSISGMSTRSNSSREAMPVKVTLTKSSTISEGLGRGLKSSLKASIEEIVEEVPKFALLSRSSARTNGEEATEELPKSGLTRSTSLRRAVKYGSEASGSSKSSSSPTDTDTANQGHLSRTLRPTDANDRVGPALSQANTCSSARKSRVVDPKEHSTLLRSSRPREVLSSLRAFRDNLSSSQTSSVVHLPRSTLAHPVVDKWVDYTNKYGIAYMLSDNTVGCVLRSSDDVRRQAACVVVREGKSHYVRRSREPLAEEAQQLLPVSGLPVEFYEHFTLEGLKKVVVPADFFELDVQAFGEKATSELAETKMKTHYDHEKLRLVMLLDKFGKYMAKTVGQGEADGEGTRLSRRPKSSQKLLKFYQRCGNVGIWGFCSSSSSASSTESVAFQFNFPDHTKVIAYEDGNVLDVYHLQAADARALAEQGAFSPRALDRRRMMTLNSADVLNAVDSGLRTMEKEILAANQMAEKLAWIRNIFAIWIREGGLGKMGVDEGVLHWQGLQEMGKSRLNWVAVGREGGD